MPALSYKGRFVDYVEAGLQKPRPKGKRIKRQTIRNFRKYPIKSGDTLYHYYGMRTKYCRRIGESICKSQHWIRIYKDSVVIGDCWISSEGKVVHGKKITRTKGLDAFARADGFESWDEMRKWWVMTHGANCFPFTGQLIKW